LDTNVLTIASALDAQWVHPRIPLAELQLIKKVFDWVRAFRDDPARMMILDRSEAILEEYKSPRNMPDYRLYGRQVVAHKFASGAVRFVDLKYWLNGNEKVAVLPPEIEALVHDLGDRKMLAAAHAASACLVNACDSDWENPNEQQALAALNIQLVQILTPNERAACKSR
jgi:hypothetical protein